MAVIKTRVSRGKKGFTMIEIVALLVIIGIVSAVAIARMTNTSEYDLATEVEVVKGHLRYAQSLAMNTNVVWGINFFSATQYSLFRNGLATDTVLIPGQDANIVSLPAGISFTPTSIVSFDSWGRPYTNEAGTAAQSGDLDIALSEGGYTRSLTITQNTGFIP